MGPLRPNVSIERAVFEMRPGIATNLPADGGQERRAATGTAAVKGFDPNVFNGRSDNPGQNRSPNATGFWALSERPNLWAP